MPKSKKDKFEALDDEFKERLAAANTDAIKQEIARVAMAQEDLMRAKEDDQDLSEKQEAAKEAGLIYREGSKMNRLRIQFAKRVLDDRAVET